MTSLHRLLSLALLLLPFTLAVGCGDDDGPDIPHVVSSQSDATCVSCHDHGVDGAPEQDHDPRTGCVDCHAVVQTAVAPIIPHATSDTAASSCLGCHLNGTQGAPQTPHSGWPACINCHSN